MAEESRQEATVAKNTLVIAILISIALTAVIVGSIVFAWQNGTITDDDLFRQNLLETETESLEEQLEIVTQEAE